MNKKFIITAFALTLIAFSCSKKKGSDLKQDNPELIPSIQDKIMSEEISTKPEGSDVGESGALKTVHFEYDRYTIIESAKSELQENAKYLKDHPGINVQIEGHCDERGSVEYNLALGEKRAESVKTYLVSMGIDSSRLSIVSYGEEKPFDMEHSESAWSQNRRAAFVILAK